MTPTKDQQAQEYVLNRQTARHNAKNEEEATMADFDNTRKVWDAYDMEQAFEDGYTACEQSMTDSEATVIQGWVAIDEAYGEAFLHEKKPILKNQPIADTGDYNCVWHSDSKTYLLDAGLFPDMDCESEPREVEITIKPKKR